MTKNWFAVHTQHRKEALAEEHLLRQGYTVYLPQIQETRRLRGAKRKVIVPMFPRYLFVQLDLEKDNTAPIRSTRGAIGLVRFGLKPRALPNQLVEQLMLTEDKATGLHIIKPVEFKFGDKVVVQHGPLAGAEAIYKAKSGQERVVVLMNLLGKQTPTQVAEDSIERVA